MADTYDRGDTARVSITITANDVAVDPATLTLTFTAPSGTQTVWTYLTNPEIVRTGPGAFYADVALIEAGLWAYDWRAAAPTQVDSGELSVGLPATEHTADDLLARSRIARLTDAASHPELHRDDLDELVRLARRPDPNGVPPSDTAWAPTYDINAAVAAGWEIKAGRVAGDFGWAEDGQMFRREQIYQHCMAMVRHYSGSGMASVRIRSTLLGLA